MTDLLGMADERFVSLTTFRRGGEPVSTPVWVARDGDALVVLTPSASGKVRRLRRDPRVEVRPCGRFGAVAPGSPTARGTAAVQDDTASETRARGSIRSAYPVESRIVLGIERTVERLRRRPPARRLALRITPVTGS